MIEAEESAYSVDWRFECLMNMRLHLARLESYIL